MHIFYGGAASGKSTAVRQLASELRIAYGWSAKNYTEIGAVTTLDAETKPIGTAVFNMLASGEPIPVDRDGCHLHGQAQTTTVRTLIVCMATYGTPSPISPDISVSLVARADPVLGTGSWRAPRLSRAAARGKPWRGHINSGGVNSIEVTSRRR